MHSNFFCFVYTIDDFNSDWYLKIKSGWKNSFSLAFPNFSVNS